MIVISLQMSDEPEKSKSGYNLKVEHTGLKPTDGYTFSEFRLNAVQSLFRLCKRHGRPS